MVWFRWGKNYSLLIPVTYAKICPPLLYHRVNSFTTTATATNDDIATATATTTTTTPTTITIATMATSTTTTITTATTTTIPAITTTNYVCLLYHTNMMSNVGIILPE